MFYIVHLPFQLVGFGGLKEFLCLDNQRVSIFTCFLVMSNSFFAMVSTSFISMILGIISIACVMV